MIDMALLRLTGPRYTVDSFSETEVPIVRPDSPVAYPSNSLMRIIVGV